MDLLYKQVMNDPIVIIKTMIPYEHKILMYERDSLGDYWQLLLFFMIREVEIEDFDN